MGTESADPVLDGAMLAELREDLGDDFEGFVRQFMANAGQTMDAVEVSVHAGDLADVAARAHALKGTAGYLGAGQLTRCLGRLQRAAEGGEADGARAAATAAGEALARLADALAANGVGSG